ncbi:hypothetical protein ACHAWF_006664 [Thalassiosira exigua]
MTLSPPTDASASSVGPGRAGAADPHPPAANPAPSSPTSPESRLAPRPKLPPVSTLFVWDFDWTLVNCNSDEYVPAQFLGDDVANRRLRELYRPGRWHEAVAALVNECVRGGDGEGTTGGGREERRSRREEIYEAAARMPYLEDVAGGCRDAANCEGCGQAIISDGNDGFIGAFLEENGLAECFAHGIETNRAEWKSDGDDPGANDDDGEFFRVIYQSSKYGGHGCPQCPPNLCKSQVLRDVLARTGRMAGGPSEDDGAGERPRVVYVGDGSNDACPAVRVLERGDVLLARAGRRIADPNSKSGAQADAPTKGGGGTFPILATLDRYEKEEGTHPKCDVRTWTTGRELRARIGDALDAVRSRAPFE